MENYSWIFLEVKNNKLNWLTTKTQFSGVSTIWFLACSSTGRDGNDATSGFASMQSIRTLYAAAFLYEHQPEQLPAVPLHTDFK